MSKGLNKVTLIGHLGSDIDLKFTQNGTAVANLSLATNESRKINGEWQDATEWHRVTVWGKTAESCAEYLGKGSQVYVEGRLQTRKWQDRDGADRWTTEVVAGNVIFLGGKGGGGGRQDEPPPPMDDDIPF